ncbi:MAG: TetR/AcrR family transcriptional regulator [Pseudomonadota bacterium]
MGKVERQAEIEDAAYRVLERDGYAKATMAAIAREAKASHETLYNWYGDKVGLFRALVARNAEEVRGLLEAAIAGEADPKGALEQLGPKLLELLLGERAINLNRAAAADASGELGAAIAENGREAVVPLIATVLDAARADGLLAFDDMDAAAELYVRLLVGDLQIRRVIGRIEGPDEAFREERGRAAVRDLAVLLG